MNKKNLLVLGVIIALIAVVAVLAAVIPQQRTISENAPALSTDAPVVPTEAPAATDAPAAAEAPAATIEPAKAYLLVSVQGGVYEPIPLTEEGSYTVKQGEEMANVIHVTPDSIWMESSTCDNQDCVLQGTVSLANRADRVLQNMILCLPNEVVLELYTEEEVASLLLSMAGYTGEDADE